MEGLSSNRDRAGEWRQGQGDRGGWTVSTGSARSGRAVKVVTSIRGQCDKGLQGDERSRQQNRG